MHIQQHAPKNGAAGGSPGGGSPLLPGLLGEHLPENRVRCHVCPRYCSLGEGQVGFCQVRTNRGGSLAVMNYGQVAALAVDPIEKKPLYHFFPGSRVLSLGSWGCNFRCKHCQNWELAYAKWLPSAPCGWEVDGQPVRGRLLSPEQVVEAALAARCSGVAWTYNEPGIWLEYTIDVARLAHDAGLYTAYVTNGYLTAEAIDLIAPHLDAFRVDVKGFTDRLYRALGALPRRQALAPVLEAAVHARRRGVHVEVVTNVIPTWNDAGAELARLAAWIHEQLGLDVPWHLTPFHPDAHLRDLPRTSVATLETARSIGLAQGLRHVYIGVPGHPASHTDCPTCGRRLITRDSLGARAVTLSPSGCCSACGASLSIRRRLRREGKPPATDQAR